MKITKVILIIAMLIIFAPTRAVERWADNTYAYQPELMYSSYDMRNMSASQMSAQNFSTLTAESETDTGRSILRGGRPSDPAIGDGDFHSPIGSGLIPLLICAMLFVIYRRKKALGIDGKL